MWVEKPALVLFRDVGDLIWSKRAGAIANIWVWGGGGKIVIFNAFKCTLRAHCMLAVVLVIPPNSSLHPSITRLRVPSKFPRIPTRTKKYQSFFSILSPTIRLQNSFFTMYWLFFLCLCVFVCFLQFCSASWLLLSINDIYGNSKF